MTTTLANSVLAIKASLHVHAASGQSLTRPADAVVAQSPLNDALQDDKLDNGLMNIPEDVINRITIPTAPEDKFVYHFV